jgi:glutamyl-tRNA synthetase
VVVDDAAMAIDEVVRGDDLLASTPRQLLLYRALASKAPRFGHVPLLLGEDGIRLSKRHAGTSLAELRAAGWSADAVVGRLAAGLGLRSDPRPIPVRGGGEGCGRAAWPPRPGGVRI